MNRRKFLSAALATIGSIPFLRAETMSDLLVSPAPKPKAEVWQAVFTISKEAALPGVAEPSWSAGETKWLYLGPVKDVTFEFGAGRPAEYASFIFPKGLVEAPQTSEAKEPESGLPDVQTT